MTSWTMWTSRTCGIFAAFALIAGCSFEPAPDADDEDATMEQALSPGACTAVTLTSPTRTFTGEIAVPMALSATASCPAGSTPEFQFWVKMTGAQNWTILGPFGPSASSWTPPALGSWAVTAVVRATGSPDTYQARAMSATGTITPPNHAPTAGDDTLSTTENVAASVDVFSNDADPDGDGFAITSHTNPNHGTVTFFGSVATYTPSTGFIGGDSFAYSIADGRGGSASANVIVTVANQAPLTADDVIATFVGAPGHTNVLANDSDPDGDGITVLGFTQGAHGGVSILNGIATYTPAAGFEGSDSFTYTIVDSHGATATGTVNVTVDAQPPACTISITGPATATFGENLHLSASAVCTGGQVQVAWLKRINSAFTVIQPFSPSPELDFTTDTVGITQFIAIARVQGTTPSQATSNALNVRISDNATPCTAVRMVSPSNNAMLAANQAATLTASATCPAGTTPEFQFWVKPVGAPNWSMLPDFTTGSGSWTPTQPGAWNIRAVVRTTGSHVNYQAGSMAVAVTVN